MSGRAVPIAASLSGCVVSQESMVQGEDLVLTFQLDPVVNVTGLSFEYSMAYIRGGPLAIPTIDATLPNPGEGQVQVVVPAAYTSQLPYGYCAYIGQLRCVSAGSQAVLSQVTWTMGPAIVPVGG